MAATHEVFNQPPPLIDYDVADDPALLDALAREEAGWAAADVRALGQLAGSAQAREWGRLANEHPPSLHTHDRFGNRIDEVEFHPAWHSLMRVAVEHGLHAAPWASARAGAHVARAAGFYVWGSTDAGHTCPVSMTYASVPALRHSPELAGSVRAAADRDRVRPRPAPAAGQARPAGRHVDDREAGRLRRPREHHPRGSGGRRRLPADRPQVVHLGADERPVPGPRPVPRRGRAVLLPAAAGQSGWLA